MREIVNVQLERVVKQIADSKQIELSLDDEVKSLLAEDGYDPIFGARPLKRLIQNKILNPLAVEIIEGRIKEGQTIKVVCPDGKIKFRLLA